MNKKILNKLDTVRHLTAADLNLVEIMQVRPGKLEKSEVFDQGFQQVREFCAQSDGARFGLIDIFSLAIIEQRGNEIADYDQMKWVQVGQILYEPLLVDHLSSQIARYRREDNSVLQLTSSFDEFIDEFAMGMRYRELCSAPDEDHYYQYIVTSHIFG